MNLAGYGLESTNFARNRKQCDADGVVADLGLCSASLGLCWASCGSSPYIRHPDPTRSSPLAARTPIESPGAIDVYDRGYCPMWLFEHTLTHFFTQNRPSQRIDGRVTLNS